MADQRGPSNVGDVGRRVARRRRELGLSVEDLAARAGMSPAYVTYLESQPAQLTQASAMRLAVALETSVDVLLGGGVELPAGQGGAESWCALGGHSAPRNAASSLPRGASAASCSSRLAARSLCP